MHAVVIDRVHVLSFRPFCKDKTARAYSIFVIAKSLCFSLHISVLAMIGIR